MTTWVPPQEWWGGVERPPALTVPAHDSPEPELPEPPLHPFLRELRERAAEVEAARAVTRRRTLVRLLLTGLGATTALVLIAWVRHLRAARRDPVTAFLDGGGLDGGRCL